MSASLDLSLGAAAYHADPCEKPSLSCGVAKILLAQSARKAWLAHPRLNPDHRERHDEKFDLGTVAHSMLLEDDTSKIVVVDADDWRTKVAKEARDEARAAGKTPLLARHFADAQAMVTVAREYIKTSEIAECWADGISEATITWTDGDTHLRIRPDRLTTDQRICVDYKTTENCAPEAFTRTIPNLGYHIQASFYERGIRALNGGLPVQFIFLAQETAAPYDCALYGCDPMLTAIGEAQVEHAVGLWAAHMKSGEWPGYGPRVHWAAAPQWLAMQTEALGGSFARESK